MKNASIVKRSRIVQFLLLPSSYPHSSDLIKHIQTHASDVFIAPPFVYKIKKPVDFGFLNYSTLEKRKYYCQKELELNKRLCCSAYIGIEEVSLKDGTLKLGAGDKTVEYTVKMHLLPERHFLHNLLRNKMACETDFTRIAEKLATYYKKQSPPEDIKQYGQSERIKSVIDQNLAHCKQFIGKTISPNGFSMIELYNKHIFQSRSELFTKRMEGGWIKDCHGDLRLEHVNLSNDDICIYDCIEFNESFRYIDIASDLAFLSMDLDYNGYSGFSSFFISEISRMMKDEGIYEVLDFYKCYRAYVRGKVESLKAHELEVPDNERDIAQQSAYSFFKLALKYALFGSKPVIIVTFGVIGSGKSTVANALSEELSFDIISSDIVRKKITGLSKYERRYVEYDTGIYSSDVTEKTYEEILNFAEAHINKYKSVIIDASFSKTKWRESIVELTERLNVPLYFIHTKAPRDVVEKRLTTREKQQKTISDGRLEILDRFLSDFEEPIEVSEENLIVVDTRSTIVENTERIFNKILLSNISLSQFQN